MLQNLNQISPLSVNVIEFILTIAKMEKVEKIMVFGSRAFGDFEKYSDLDIAIDAPNMTKFEWLKLKEYAIYDLDVFIKVSLVHYSSNPHKLKERINLTGKVIYAR